MLLLDEAGVEVPLTSFIAEAISALRERLGESEDLVLLGQEEELTPGQAAKILGIGPWVARAAATSREGNHPSAGSDAEEQRGDPALRRRSRKPM